MDKTLPLVETRQATKSSFHLLVSFSSLEWVHHKCRAHILRESSSNSSRHLDLHSDFSVHRKGDYMVVLHDWPIRIRNKACCMLWFGSRVFPKGWCVEGLVPNAALGEVMDYKGSDLFYGLTHWWIHNLVVVLGVDRNFRRGKNIVGGCRSLGVCRGKVYLASYLSLGALTLQPPFHCFLETMRWTA